MMDFCQEKKEMQERLNIDMLDGARHIKQRKFNADRCKVNELKKLDLLSHRKERKLLNTSFIEKK